MHLELTYDTLDSYIIIIDVFTMYYTWENYTSITWGRYTNGTDRRQNFW